MKSFTKQMPGRVSILIIALIVCISISSACSSSNNTGNNSSKSVAAVGENQANASEKTAANAKELPKPTPAIQADEPPTFKKGEDYKTSVREKLLKAGWKPARSDEGEMNCEGGGSFCEEFPELDGGPAAGQGKAIFRWERGGKILLIYTVDDPPFYSEQQIGKSGTDDKTNDISGKYVYRYTEDYGGKISFVFKQDKKLDYEWAQEDVTWKGGGHWIWDEGKQTLTATVFTEPDADSAAESENTSPRKEVFIFQKVGNNLKLTAPPVGMNSYKGKIFQK